MSNSKKERHWTEAAIVSSLSRLWPNGAYVTLPQVRNGTGYGRSRTRTADAIVASVWPSNGIWFAGVEVKLTRGDLRKELSDPSKSEAIAKYCHRWYIAGPSQLFGETERAMIPETWGIVACSGNTTEIVRQSAIREPQPVDALFVCSLLRSAAELIPAVRDEEDRKAELNAAREAGKAEAERQARNLAEAVAEFENASGVKITDRWHAGDIGKAVALVRSNGHLRVVDLVADMRRATAVFEKQAAKALQECGLDYEV
jgi:hypothetical protein